MRWIAFGIKKALFISTRDKSTLEFPICSINTQPIHGDTAQDRDTYLLEDLRPASTPATKHKMPDQGKLPVKGMPTNGQVLAQYPQRRVFF
jgi:hypothetical protein